MNQVLLIDDDTELVGMFSEYLEQEGFRVACAHDGETGAREALTGQYAIAILDVMMPRMNGIETLRRIRAASRMPILMLTGRGDDADRILGLELGADDYVTKPCTPRELTARVRAILRRTQSSPNDGPGITLTVGKLTMLPEQRRATWDGQPLELTSTEFNLLEVLARNAGLVLTRDQLLERVWGYDFDVRTDAVDTFVSYLRRKLEADGRPRLVHTVRGVGFVLRDESP